MAQAEFERNKQQGGFDSTSYRAAEPESGARVLTPLQQKLAGLEKALPAALRSRALAFVLAAAVLAAGVVGIGGAKLQARANEAAGWYTVGAPGDNGYNLNEELTLRANTAANVITTALNTPGLGAEAGAVTAAQAADELLSLKGVKASFVVFRSGENVQMSARSLGEINVQVILEALGGGGNSTTAGGRVENTDVETVKTRLLEAIDAYFEK